MSSSAPAVRPVAARNSVLPEPPSWGAQVMAVFRKDLAIEARTGEVVVTSGFLALLLVVLSSLSLYGGPSSNRLVASGVIWLSIAFAAVLALGKSWQRGARRERARGPPGRIRSNGAPSTPARRSGS